MAHCSQCEEAINVSDQLAEGVGHYRHCGVVVNLSTEHVAYIPQDTPKSGSRVRSILKWAGIGCGGIVGLFLVLIVIGVTSDDESEGKIASNYTNTSRTVIRNPDPTVLSPSDRERLARWKQTFTHWDDIEAFQQSIEDINADRVISKDESAYICSVLDQWKAQHRAALDHVAEYRRVEPEMVTANYGFIEGLEREAQRGLDLLTAFECK